MSDKATTSAKGYSVRCTHCQAVLKSPVPVPAGKTIKCPACKKTFTTSGEAGTKVQGQTEAKSAPGSSPLDDDAEMVAAIAKLQGDGGLSAPAAAPTKPAPSPAPAPAAGLDDDDEMAAAIAKLQGDGGLGAAAATAPTPPAPAAESEPAIPDMEIPEVDDDLVVPDEEPDADVAEDFEMEVVDDDEKPSAKKKRKRDDDGEKPRPKKNRKRDDDEDEEPRSRKKSKRDDDEENDPDEDERQSRKKSRRDDDDDKAGKPRSRKKSRRDDDDEDDEPRSKKKKTNKAGSPLLLIGLIGGGIFVLLLCVGAGIGGYLLFGSGGGPDVVGRWEQRDIIVIPWEFRANGTGKVVAIFTINFNYRQSGNEMTITFTGIEGVKGGGPAKMNGRESLRVRVTRTGDTLRFEDLDGRQPPTTLHKVN